MKVLEDKQIILRGPKVGRSYAFMLNPEFGWKGKVTNLEDYRQREWDKETKHLKALASKAKTPQTSPKQRVKKVKKHSSEINQLSKQFDIPTEKLEKLLTYFQDIQENPVNV